MIMKKILYPLFTGCLALLLFGACSDDDQTLPVILPAEQGTFTDSRDGVEYRWVRYGDLEWMAENLRAEVNTGVCRVYVDNYHQTDEEKAIQEEQNFSKYGYWYDFEAAEAAVPDGWRLPTDEDWQKLELYLGMSGNEVNRMDWRAGGQGEMMQQKKGLALLPGGFIDYEQISYGVLYTPGFISFYGFFWTSTADKDSSGNDVIYRQIRYNSSELGRFSTRPEKLMHVRCVRSAGR